MTRFLLMCPAAVLLTLSPESAVALRVSRCDGEGCGLLSLIGRRSALQEWQTCAAELSKKDIVPLLEKLGTAHRDFAGAAGSEVLVVQGFNQRVKTRYALKNFFFPSEEKKKGYNEALEHERVRDWMKRECDTVTPTAYASEQRKHAIAHADDWRSQRFFEGDFLPPVDEQKNFDRARDSRRDDFDTSSPVVRKNAGFLPLFDFHLYRSLVCSNTSGTPLDQIFAKEDVDNTDSSSESAASHKQIALEGVVRTSDAGLVFTQEYANDYHNVFQKLGYESNGNSGTRVYWKTGTLSCDDAKAEIEKQVFSEKGAMETAIWNAKKAKVDFVQCSFVNETDTSKKQFLAVSYHGASDTAADVAELTPVGVPQLGTDQLDLLRKLLNKIESQDLYSSIIVGADANQEMNKTTSIWNSSSEAVWTSQKGTDWQTCEKQRSFLQHQWKKVEKPDSQGKDHVFVLEDNSIEEVDAVYGFDEERLRVRNLEALPALPSAEWPFDHAAVKVAVRLANRSSGADTLIVLQQNLGGDTVVDKVEMSSLFGASEGDTEIQTVRQQMNLYMALYGWPQMLVTMQNSAQFGSWRSSTVPKEFMTRADLAQNFLSDLRSSMTTLLNVGNRSWWPVGNKCSSFVAALEDEVIPTGDLLDAGPLEDEVIPTGDLLDAGPLEISTADKIRRSWDNFWKNVFGF
jgi:hypothetical protein